MQIRRVDNIIYLHIMNASPWPISYLATGPTPVPLEKLGHDKRMARGYLDGNLWSSPAWKALSFRSFAVYTTRLSWLWLNYIRQAHRWFRPKSHSLGRIHGRVWGSDVHPMAIFFHVQFCENIMYFSMK